MSDIAVPAPIQICSWNRLMAASDIRLAGGLADVSSGSSAWTANAALFVPLILPWPFMMRRAFWVPGTQGTVHYDIGVYSPGGARLWSAGSTAAGANNTPQFVTANLLLAPGRYFLAFAIDSALTGAFNGNGVGSGPLSGNCFQQLSAFPLPAAATLVTPTLTWLPLIGITQTPSGG